MSQRFKHLSAMLFESEYRCWTKTLGSPQLQGGQLSALSGTQLQQNIKENKNVARQKKKPREPLCEL